MYFIKPIFGGDEPLNPQKQVDKKQVKPNNDELSQRLAKPKTEPQEPKEDPISQFYRLEAEADERMQRECQDETDD